MSLSVTVLAPSDTRFRPRLTRSGSYHDKDDEQDAVHDGVMTTTPAHQNENLPSPGPGLGSTQDVDVLPLRQIE